MPSRSGLAILFALAVLACAASGKAAESGSTFAAGDVTLYDEVLGTASGTPLVVANGGPGFDHLLLHVSKAWDELAKHRPVVLYDQRGTGRSSETQKHGGLAEQIADLDALRQHLGAEKIDLLGHSWGGFLVMAYAARHPEHIRHLIITDSAAPRWRDTHFLFKEIFPDRMERRDSLAFATEMGDTAAGKAGLREYFAMIFFAAENRDAFLAAFDASQYNYNDPVHDALSADLARYDLWPELPKYNFPTLVITGRFDANVAPEIAYKIHQAIPGSRFEVFEKSGHMPFVEEPAKFVEVLEGFLGPAASP